MTRLSVFTLVLLAACRGSGVGNTELGFRLETKELDFGKVLEGDTVSKDVTVVATGSADITVDLTSMAPFNAPPLVMIPGGSSTTFSVKFTAGTVPATGEVTLAANNGTATVKLKGIGVRPKVCAASAPCRDSVYSLATDQCVETVSPEGAACQPDSVCLEKGECRSGVCQGVARGCDDKNACTVDSCAMDLGCVHTMRACPAPTAPCRVAACDPVLGCGEGVAPDGTPCGTVDCVKALLCVAGACTEVPTPDGFVCGSATPCQGEAKCRMQKCVAPDAGVMTPRTIVKLTGQPVDERPAIVTQSGNLFFQMCGLPAPDGGVPDAGPKDAGIPDAGDAGDPDAGAVDGGDLDAGAPDAGRDAGFCGLVSYTGTGFERWTARYLDRAPRKLVHAGLKGVVLLQPDALEVRSLSTGAPAKFAFEGEVAPRGIAQTIDLEIWAVVRTPDAGARLMRIGDGGLLPDVALDAGASLLAIDEAGTAWLYQPDAGTLGWLQQNDAGWALGWTNGVPAGNGSLVTAEGRVVAGAQSLFHGDDGGLLPFAWFSDAGIPLDVLERFPVAAEGGGVAFYKECDVPQMSCTELDKSTWAYAYQLDDGRFLWRAKVLPSGAPGRIEEVALTGLKPGAFGALVSVSLDGGSQAFLEGFADGKRVLLCAMPDGLVIGGAVFTTGALHTLVSRDGGAGWNLESYDLGAAPVSLIGWPQADGISGARRAR